MLLTITLNDVLILDKHKHINTDWEVSDKEDFSNIIFNRYKDTINLTTVKFELEPIFNNVYYIRARLNYLNNKNEDISSPWIVTKTEVIKDIDTLLEVNNTPSKILPFTITTDYNPDMHPYSKFTIYSSRFINHSISKHRATTWLIEDINGKLLWMDRYNIYNLTKIKIPIELETNKLYRIKAIYHSDNNDSSPISTLTIYTSRDRTLQHTKKENVLSVSLSINFINMVIENSVINDKLLWTLYRDNAIVDRGVSYSNNICSRIENLKLYTDYILKVQKYDGKLDYEATYFPFRIDVPREAKVLDYFPLKFPYKFRS